jgi:hypothetical protein
MLVPKGDVCDIWLPLLSLAPRGELPREVRSIVATSRDGERALGPKAPKDAEGSEGDAESTYAWNGGGDNGDATSGDDSVPPPCMSAIWSLSDRT